MPDDDMDDADDRKRRRRRGRARMRAFDLIGAGANAAVASDLDADAQAYITAVGGLDATHEAAVNTYVLALKAAGVWDKIGRRYLLANQTATAARTDLKTAGDLLTVNGAPVFAADGGYTGDGVSDYLVSAYNPTGSGLVGQDDAHLIAVDATSEAFPNAGTGSACGAYDGAADEELRLRPQSASVPSALVNNDAPVNGAAANSLGIWHATRTAADAMFLYFNGVEDGTSAGASVALVNSAFTVLASRADGGGLLTTHQIRVAGIGAGLTPAEVAADATATEAYLDAIGAGVVA